MSKSNQFEDVLVHQLPFEFTELLLFTDLDKRSIKLAKEAGTFDAT